MPCPSDITWEHVPCPLCGSDQYAVHLVTRDLLFSLPGEFQLVRCKACRHLYLNPRPSADCIHHFYPKHYGPHHLAASDESLTSTQGDSVNSGKRPWYLSRLIRGIPGLRSLYYWLSESHAEVIPEVHDSPKRALELGCADGCFLERLQQQGWEAQGVELVAGPARRAQQRGLQVHVGQLEPGLFPSRYFDAVFAWMVIEHLHDPQATLREIRRIAKESAWLVFSVPNVGCWEPLIFRRYWYSLQLPTHLHQFTPHTLRQLLHQNGFELVRVIHQRNVLSIVGSLGIWLREQFPWIRLGPKLVRFADDVSLWGRLALAPLAILLAWLHQGGRLTVVARVRPDASVDDESR